MRKSIPPSWKAVSSGFLITPLLLFGMMACRNQATETVMFREDGMHSGIFTPSAPDHLPQIKWKFKAGGDIHSTAAITNGRIYFGSKDGNLYCLDQETGKEIWKYKTNGAVYASPALENGVLFAGSHDGHFYALNADDGKLVWDFETDGERYFSAKGLHGRKPADSLFVDDWDFFLSSPVLANEMVYFGTGSGFFYALDQATGNLNWKFRTNGVVHASPAVAYGNVYFGSWDSYFYALDAWSGAEKWKAQTGIDTVIYNQVGFQGSPLISDSMVYVGCRDARMYAFDALTGARKWDRFNNFSWVSSSPVIYNDALIYLTSDSKSLVALNKISGDSIYSRPTKTMVFSSPALVGGTLYYGQLNGLLSAADAATGRTLWTYQLESSVKDQYHILNPDSTLNGKLVFSAEKRKETGLSSLEMVFSLGSIIASPVIKDGVIYFGAADGWFYAMK